MSSFYVGYQPRVPADLRPTLRRAITGFAALAVGLAIILVFSQSPFPAASFEFLNVRSFEGTLVETPYPMLLVRRPDVSGAEEYSRYLLVAEGKHGADREVRGHEGEIVRLRGKLIYRDDQTMIEVASGSVQKLGQAAQLPKPVDLGMATLTGEIVDTKCYTGVMNPGRGKVHRDCAARCISGGIPAALLVQDASGGASLYLLTDAAGKPLGRELLGRVAEPVTLSGRIYRSGSIFTLAADRDRLPLRTAKR